MPFDINDQALPHTLLTLKQRFKIGFSNGCPWPEKAIAEHLESQISAISSLEQLEEGIRESGLSDGKHSMLFQNLLQFASKPLKKELLSYHPWEALEKQENQHLPDEVTDPKGKGGYGIAYDPPFFDVLKPLYRFIDEEKDRNVHNARHLAVVEFFEKTASKVKTIDELVKQTNKFLAQPKYVKQFLPRNYASSPVVTS